MSSSSPNTSKMASSASAATATSPSTAADSRKLPDVCKEQDDENEKGEMRRKGRGEEEEERESLKFILTCLRYREFDLDADKLAGTSTVIIGW